MICVADLLYQGLWLLLLLSRFSCVGLCDPIDRREPTRLHRPWDSPGKNTGAGCHFLLQCMNVKSESDVTQLYLTLSDLMDCSLPGSSVHGILQSRMLGWVPLPSLWGFPKPGIILVSLMSSALASGFFITSASTI